ncbi:2-dehydropantoate 2-reductase [Xanthobacteraceae bacterium Astr-EGSB]|uniref:2-dehydropantoate 2-reductase n=1 Tax=Astrobacterium formosum TaxID=3069710 RepID=UPI0027B79AD9|nr:2-dehydropantoate 2-reductase [Xanthobacteraceae bacterium Astr-EGSB]
MTTNPTIAVIGLGAIGGIIAGSLAAAGRKVVACVRTPFDRLMLERPEGRVEVAPEVLTDPAGAAIADWVLVATKTHQTASVAPWLERLCGPATRVAVLQNGIDRAAAVAAFAGPAAVMQAIVYYNGEFLGPGHVRLRHAGNADLAVLDDGCGRAFAALLDGVPLRVDRVGDLRTLLWRKLLLNITVNPVTALTLQRQAVSQRDDIQALYRALLGEAVAVAAADGARLGAEEVERTVSTLLGYPPDAGTSMYFDRLAGRPLEVEALTGALVAAADRYGVAVPLNRAVLALLCAVSAAADKR